VIICPGMSVDFDRHAYFLDVKIIKSGIDGKPGLAAVSMFETVCAP